MMFFISGINPVASVRLSNPQRLTDIEPGVDVKLVCHVQGSGQISYQWFRWVLKKVLFLVICLSPMLWTDMIIPLENAINFMNGWYKRLECNRILMYYGHNPFIF